MTYISFVVFKSKMIHFHYLITYTLLLSSIISLSAPCNISKLDAVFAIDMSSASQAYYKGQKNALEDFVKAISKSGQYNDVALVSYAKDAQVAYPFAGQFNFNDFSAKLAKLQAMGDGRQANKAILEAYNKLFKPRHVSDGAQRAGKQSVRQGGYRIAQNKLFVLFTAGEQDSTKGSILPTEAARLLRDLGVHIVVLEFAPIKNQLIRDVATTQEDVFKMHEGDQLKSAWAKICAQFKEGNFD